MRTEIINTKDTDLRYSVWQTQISIPEIFKHETQISIPEIFHAIHNTQVLRYSTQKTQISRPEIFSMVDADNNNSNVCIPDLP